MANRDDVLSDFTVEEEISSTVLKTYLQRYPEYTKDLLALFSELTMSDLEATKTSLPLETRGAVMIYAKVCPRGFANECTIFAIPEDKIPEFEREYGDLKDRGDDGYTTVYKDPEQWVKNRAVAWDDRHWL